jgi:hypothetical protein
MTAESQPRRGPRPLSKEAITQFTRVARPAAFCGEGRDGELLPMPVQLLAASSDAEFQLLLVDGPSSTTIVEGGAACVVADEFESYEGIRGVIAQGRLRAVSPAGGPPRDATFSVRKLRSFNFADSLPSSLRGDDGTDGTS